MKILIITLLVINFTTTTSSENINWDHTDPIYPENIEGCAYFMNTQDHVKFNEIGCNLVETNQYILEVKSWGLNK